MTNRQLSLADLRLAVEEVGASPAALAERLNISRSTVYDKLRKYPELKQAFEKKRGEPLQERTQNSYEAVKAAIEQSHGIKASVAAALGCSRQTVDNYLKLWTDLAELLESQRSKLVTTAVSALVKDIQDPIADGHQRAYLFVLKTLGKDEGFAERQEITGADGGNLFELPPDVVAFVKDTGLNVAEALRQFAEMVKRRAA